MAQVTRSRIFGHSLRMRQLRKQSVRHLEDLFFEIAVGSAPAVFIEAGAKDARASLRMRTLSPDTEIVACEANPHTYARFKKKLPFKASKIDYRHVALSNGAASVELNVRINSKGNAARDGRASLKHDPSYLNGHMPESVKATTVDAISSEFDTEKGIAIWIDVEGANQEVLEGAGAALGSTSALFIEVETSSIWTGQWLATDVRRYLESHGLVEVARDYQARNQHNRLYVRESALRDDSLQRSLFAYSRRRKATGPLLRLTQQYLELRG